MAKLVVDGADYEGAVLFTAMRHGLEQTMICATDMPECREHFEKSFWHLVSMMQRLYRPSWSK